MDFRLSESEERLRAEVCQFLTEELGTTHTSEPQPMPPGYMPARDFERKLGERGWLALSWPPQYGGGGRPVAEQFIAEEEVALHGGPASPALPASARSRVRACSRAASGAAPMCEWFPTPW